MQLKSQLTSEERSMRQRSLITNLKKKFSKTYEGQTMATFKTLAECEAVSKLLSIEQVTHKQKILRGSRVEEAFAIILLEEPMWI